MNGNRTSRQWPADMPGVTTAWLARANGVSERTIRWRRARVRTRIENMLTIDAQVGLELAQGRPKGAHVSLWTRLAMMERVANGGTYQSVAVEFGVSVATVQRSVRGYGRGFHLPSGVRVLSATQIKNLKKSPKLNRR